MSLDLTIGGVTLADFEIPESFGAIGGEQKRAVHDHPGGLRTLQALGYFPFPQCWRGLLMGDTALALFGDSDNSEILLDENGVNVVGQDIFLVPEDYAYLGQDQMNERVGDNVDTLGGPATNAKAKA